MTKHKNPDMGGKPWRLVDQNGNEVWRYDSTCFPNFVANGTYIVQDMSDDLLILGITVVGPRSINENKSNVPLSVIIENRKIMQLKRKNNLKKRDKCLYDKSAYH